MGEHDVKSFAPILDENDAFITKYVSLNRLEKRLRTILYRDINRLMEVSFVEALNKDQSQALRQYIEIVNELQELDKIRRLENIDKKDGKNVEKKN